MTVSDWSTTAGSNVLSTGIAGTGGVNIDEGMAPSGVNNAMRSIMSQLADYTRRGSDLASAATLNLDSIDALLLNVTGTTTVTAVTLTSGHWRIVRATGAFQITASASLIVNASVSLAYTTKVGDYLLFEGYGSSVVRVSLLGPVERRVGRQIISGLALSNNTSDATNDIDIATGVAASDDNVNPALMVNGSILTKRLDAAWAVGNGNGGLDTGSIADDVYHVWLIERSDTGVVDALFSASATSPTMPANYDRKRRIGSIIRASAAIVPFVQLGNYFYRSVPAQTVSTTNPGTSGITETNEHIPDGVTLRAIISVQLTSSTTSTSYAGLVTAMEQADSTPSTTLNNVLLRTGPAAGTYQSITNLEVPTTTSAQFRYRLSASDASITVSIITHGWVDYRGDQT